MVTSQVLRVKPCPSVFTRGRGRKEAIFTEATKRTELVPLCLIAGFDGRGTGFIEVLLCEMDKTATRAKKFSHRATALREEVVEG
jgi:hypothetical protein